jgi:hypothetical protein
VSVVALEVASPRSSLSLVLLCFGTEGLHPLLLVGPLTSWSGYRAFRLVYLVGK